MRGFVTGEHNGKDSSDRYKDEISTLNFGLKHTVEEIKTAVMPWNERDSRLR